MSKDIQAAIAEQALQCSMDRFVMTLSREAGLRGWLCSESQYSARCIAKTEELVQRAFVADDVDAQAEAHAALFVLYELHVCAPTAAEAVNQHEPLFYDIRRRLEDAWLATERRRLGAALRESSTGLKRQIKTLCLTHDAASHALFDFLEHDADAVAMDRFFASDSALNVRFFDLLALALVGSAETARPELVQNLWDESGRGNKAEAHVRSFRDLLEWRSLPQERSQHARALTFEGHAGHNLFMMTALNRVHANKLLGVMAVTELIDPSSYMKVVKGCRRIGYDEWSYRYYSEHIEVDIVHGNGWLDNVIEPTVACTPEAAADILLGAHMRLETCARYYGCLLDNLKAPMPVDAASVT